MKAIKTLQYLLIISLLISCSQDKTSTKITVKNTLNSTRTFETIEISKELLKTQSIPSSIGLKNIKNGVLEVTQLVDDDGDGTFDKLLFQPIIKANSEENYEVVTISETEKVAAENLCFSRFVPERTDDYTWENNKVAFRVFG